MGIFLMLAAPVLSWTNCILWGLQNATSGTNKTLKRQSQNRADRQSVRFGHDGRGDARPNWGKL